MGLGGDDQIVGLGGDDVICGGAGNDQLIGGSGVDTAKYDDAYPYYRFLETQYPKTVGLKEAVEGAGFTLAEEWDQESFGKELHAEIWELRF